MIGEEDYMKYSKVKNRRYFWGIFQLGTLVQCRGVIREGKSDKPIVEITDFKILVE